jgi:hypothetical protein
MANNTLTADVIAKIALPILDNELGFLNKMHRAHEDEFGSTVNGYKKGDTISIRRPADFTVRSGATMSTQDVIEGKTTLTVDQQKGVDFQFTSTDLTLKVEDMAERIIKPAMVNLSNTIAQDVLSTMYKSAYNWVGTPGQTINSFSDFLTIPKRMDVMTMPSGDRNSVLSPDDYYGLIGSQTALFSPSLVQTAYRDGDLGMLSGVATMMTQVVPTHTVGAHAGTPLVNGATQNVTYDTAKNTWTQSLITDGWSNSITGILKEGDVFTIAGVYMVNAKTKAETTILQQFVVRADADSGASTGPATLTISPPIITSGPHQTVSAAPADNAAITVMGTASTGYVQNLAWHKTAMSLAFVPMEMPEAAYGGSRKTHKNISIRLIPTYDATNDISKWRLDVLYGRKLTDPRLALRASGTA